MNSIYELPPSAPPKPKLIDLYNQLNNENVYFWKLPMTVQLAAAMDWFNSESIIGTGTFIQLRFSSQDLKSKVWKLLTDKSNWKTEQLERFFISFVDK